MPIIVKNCNKSGDDYYNVPDIDNAIIQPYEGIDALSQRNFIGENFLGVGGNWGSIVLDTNRNISIYKNSVSVPNHSLMGYTGDKTFLFGFQYLGSNIYEFITGTINQTATSGNNFSAGLNVNPAFQIFYPELINALFVGGFIGALGTNGISILASSVSPSHDVYVIELGETTANVFGLFTVSGSFRLDYDIAGLSYKNGIYYTLLLNSAYDSLFLQIGTPVNGVPVDDILYKLVFDDSYINNAISAGDIFTTSATGDGFFMWVYDPLAFGEYRIFHISLDGDTYKEINLSGSNDVSNLFASNTVNIYKDGSDYAMLVSDPTNSLYYYFSKPGQMNIPAFTRNAIGVKLECGNYCIPFIKQRKF